MPCAQQPCGKASPRNRPAASCWQQIRPRRCCARATDTSRCAAQAPHPAAACLPAGASPAVACGRELHGQRSSAAVRAGGRLPAAGAWRVGTHPRRAPWPGRCAACCAGPLGRGGRPAGALPAARRPPACAPPMCYPAMSASLEGTGNRGAVAACCCRRHALQSRQGDGGLQKGFVQRGW